MLQSWKCEFENDGDHFLNILPKIQLFITAELLETIFGFREARGLICILGLEKGTFVSDSTIPSSIRTPNGPPRGAGGSRGINSSLIIPDWSGIVGSRGLIPDFAKPVRMLYIVRASLRARIPTTHNRLRRARAPSPSWYLNNLLSFCLNTPWTPTSRGWVIAEELGKSKWICKLYCERMKSTSTPKWTDAPSYKRRAGALGGSLRSLRFFTIWGTKNCSM